MTTQLDLGAAPAVAWRERVRALMPAIGRCFLAERERWPLWLPVFMGAGIGTYFWLGREPPPWLGAALLMLAVAFGAALWRRGRALAPVLALGAFALGFAAAQGQARLVAAPVLTRRLGPVMIEGRLVALDPTATGARLVIAPRHIDRLAAAKRPARVRVAIRLKAGEGAPIPGTWLRLRAMLMPPPAPVLPGTYDFERAAWFERLGAVGYALGAPIAMPPPPGAGVAGWRVAVAALRAIVAARVRSALPGERGAIAATLITGDAHAIRPGDAEAFRNAGLAHLLVIAGLHMGMVAGIVFFAVRAGLALIPRIALYHPTKKYAAAAALAVTFGYMLLSGASVSSRRAFVMIALTLIAVMIDRLSVSARAVAVAAALIMLLMPVSAIGASFQMSFAAVSALVACYEALRPLIARWHVHAGAARRAMLYLAGITVTTIVTTFATMPFTIYHFGRIALYSVIGNALAVPITGFWVMPWALVACLAMPFHLEALPLAPMGWGIGAILWVARHVTAWPGAVVAVHGLTAPALALIGLGGAWLCIWLGRWRWLGLAPIVAGYLSIALNHPPDLIVAANAGAVALRAPGGVYLPSTAHLPRFLADSWTEAIGAPLGAPWPEDGNAAQGALRCDAEACLYRAGGAAIALIRDGSAIAEECGDVDLVVSPVAAHRACRRTRVIDRNDTWRDGAAAVWLDRDGAVRIETVRAWQGARPWVPRVR